MVGRPSGTVTFLFSDIEGSTERWQLDDLAMANALAAHDELIRAVVQHHGGLVFKHTGDGVCAVFESAPAAVAAAIEAQTGLHLPVRVGLHTGIAESRDGDYFGPALSKAARVMDAGHGGQVLVSSATAGLLQDHDLVDLGEQQLKGFEAAERIFQVGQGQFPELRTQRRVVGNLPAELTTFVGRSAELNSLAEELAEHRLVTLIGVGGTGKTRLAVEAGSAVAANFPDGCWMVELAPVMVADAVPFAIAAGLGMTPSSEGDVVDHLVMRLRHKRLLIVVDNCEHLLAATAHAVERIVAACPDVAVMATSREPLMVRGERLVPVPSLLPSDAEQLFLQRARDEAPDLVIDEDQRRAVTELCQRLDGLPLAVELAASRVRALTPVELVATLEERFRMLVGGRRSLMERHQTMRGTLDWSYNLCDATEQAVFDRLSVFPAAFDLPAARAVAAGDDLSDLDAADIVAHLLDRSLLQRSTAGDGTTRYRMLETMRAYGREHLQQQGVSDTVRERYVGHTARTISALNLISLGPDEARVGQRLAEFLPDALVVVDWCIEHRDFETGLRVGFSGRLGSERQVSEMFERLHDSAKEGDATPERMDEFARVDQRLRMTTQPQLANERGWRTIRARAPIPTDRVTWPPYSDFWSGGLVAGDVDELIESLDHWRSGPVVTRFLAEWQVVRVLAINGHLDRADHQVVEFADFVNGLHSRRATRYLAEARGFIAILRRDWQLAAEWFRKVVAADDNALSSFSTLMAAWNLLSVRCLCPGPVEISGSDLRDPWLCYLRENLYSLRLAGTVSSAIAVHRLGRLELADRLAAWALANPPASMQNFATARLEAAGLPTTSKAWDDDLQTLIDEVLALADELDGLG